MAFVCQAGNFWTLLRTCSKTCPTATLFTTNPTWTGLGLNLVLHGQRPTTNLLSPDVLRRDSDVACKVFERRQSVWPHSYPSANIRDKRLLSSFLCHTKEFGNTILVFCHQKQQLRVIVKQTDGDELGSLRGAVWRSVTCPELTNS